MDAIRFQKGEHPLVFSDAIALPYENKATLQISEVETVKNERYNQWVDTITKSYTDALQNQIDVGGING